MATIPTITDEWEYDFEMSIMSCFNHGIRMRAFFTWRFWPATFHWSACTKPGKWTYMYLCVDFASFCNFLFGLWNCFDIYFLSIIFMNIYMSILGMATSTRLPGYSLEHPIIEYQNRYSVTRKTFFYENNDKIFRTINN